MFTVVEVQHHAFLNGTRGKSKHINIPTTCPSYCTKHLTYLFNERTNSRCISDASFSSVIRLRRGRPRGRGSIPCKERQFLIQIFQLPVGSIRPHENWVQGYFSGIKRPKPEADHTAGEVTNAWRYTSTPLHTFVTC